MIFKKKPEGFKAKFEIAACFCEYDGKILFLKRHPNKDYGGLWNLPAGKLGVGESAEEAVIREVKEETGINLTTRQIIKIATYYDIYPEYMYFFHAFKAKVNSNDVKIKKDEATEYGWFTPKKALRIKLVPDEDFCIKDAFNL